MLQTSHTGASCKPGAVQSLTWPLAKYFPYDNIIFGETSLGFGALLIAVAFYLWMRAPAIVAGRKPAMYLARAIQPLSIFIVGMGLALIAIAMAGLVFRLFAAPPEEPISGRFAAYPWVEATFMSGMFGFVGLGAILFPLAARTFANGVQQIGGVQKLVGFVWWLSGLGFFLFGALNFFTHIGLIIHTMPG